MVAGTIVQKVIYMVKRYSLGNFYQWDSALRVSLIVLVTISALEIIMMICLNIRFVHIRYLNVEE